MDLEAARLEGRDARSLGIDLGRELRGMTLQQAQDAENRRRYDQGRQDGLDAEGRAVAEEERRTVRDHGLRVGDMRLGADLDRQRADHQAKIEERLFDYKSEKGEASDARQKDLATQWALVLSGSPDQVDAAATRLSGVHRVTMDGKWIAAMRGAAEKRLADDDADRDIRRQAVENRDPANQGTRPMTVGERVQLQDLHRRDREDARDPRWEPAAPARDGGDDGPGGDRGRGAHDGAEGPDQGPGPHGEGEPGRPARLAPAPADAEPLPRRRDAGAGERHAPHEGPGGVAQVEGLGGLVRAKPRGGEGAVRRPAAAR